VNGRGDSGNAIIRRSLLTATPSVREYWRHGDSMIPWQRLDTAPLPPPPSTRGAAPPPAAELTLWQRGDELAIRIGGIELMNSRQHHSEDELGRLACAHLGRGHVARVLIGGLGMGFTVRAVLNALGPQASVEVAELVPSVVRWNRGVLAALAGQPLTDPRVRVIEGDVGTRIGRGTSYDAIILDVDNGPSALTAADNRRLYDRRGLESIFSSLRPAGVLAVWSATDDPRFSKSLRGAGFEVMRHHVRARPEAGPVHVLSIASKPAETRAMARPGARPLRPAAARSGPARTPSARTPSARTPSSRTRSSGVGSAPSRPGDSRPRGRQR
jgi:spermidine synthase